MTTTTATMTTTTTNGRIVPQFNVWGRGYNTMVAVMGRLSTLSYANRRFGDSDDRRSEEITLMDGLIKMAVELGANNPTEAVHRAMEIVTNVSNSTDTPILTVLEEMEIAVHNTNREFTIKADEYLFNGVISLNK